MIYIDNLGIAGIGTILFESESKDENAGIFDRHTFKIHLLDCLIGHISPHGIVEAAGVTHHTWSHTIKLRLLDEVVRINRNAVATHEARLHLDEVPFRGGSIEYVIGVDAHGIEYFSQGE